jgi:hypothetical protein
MVFQSILAFHAVELCLFCIHQRTPESMLTRLKLTMSVRNGRSIFVRRDRSGGSDCRSIGAEMDKQENGLAVNVRKILYHDICKPSALIKRWVMSVFAFTVLHETMLHTYLRRLGTEHCPSSSASNSKPKQEMSTLTGNVLDG